ALQKQRHTHNHPHLQMLSLPRAVMRDFNEKTEELKERNPSPDRTYDLKIGQPTVSYFLKQVAGIQKGGQQPGGCLWRAVYEITQVKAQDEALKMQNASLETVVKSIIGLARSLGVEIVNEKPFCNYVSTAENCSADFKEAIILAAFRLVEYLEHQHLWVRLRAQNDQKQRPFF
uniref:Large ribosomal subunit protein uL11 C-terminal domain-containing protein n=1 Tax=Oncorhynchus mykiss TaxID=8022 RepID=A0A8C7V5R5_ONCMY